MTVTLATSKFCGPCMMLKNKLAAQNLEVDMKDYSIPEEMEWFKTHGIKSVPRLVIENDDGTIEVIQGMDDIIDAIKKHKTDV